MSLTGVFDRLFGGIRGAVTIAALVTTALALTVIGVLASTSLTRQVEGDVVDAIASVLDDSERRLAAGETFVSLTHPSGVEVLVGRRFDQAAGAQVLVQSRLIDLPNGGQEVLSARASTVGLNGTLGRLRTALWIFVPSAALLIAGAANLAVGAALRPVSAISAQAHRIAQGLGTGRVPVPESSDEIHDLAVKLNSMLESLEAGAERQRRFVSDAAHELRTPLMVLLAESDLASRHPDSTDQETFARTVLGQAQRLDSLTDDLLLTATAGEATSRRTSADLAQVVATELVSTPGRLDLVSDLRPVMVEVDEQLVRRAIRNLLANACRHADRRIQVTLRSDGGWARLVVEDDGAGVRMEDRDQIFERFYRPETARDRSSGGAGLGLSIVAQCAQLHGGAVEVGDSAALGGAQFTFTLPASRA